MRLHFITTIAITFLIACQQGDAQSFLGRNKDHWRRQLDSPDAGARRSAAYALGKIGGVVAIPPLVHVLQKDDDVKVKEAAAFALGDIGLDNATAVNALQKIVADGNENALVRRSAAISLGSIGRGAGEALNALEQALNDGDPNLRQNVAWALGRISEDSAPALDRALRDSDPLVKRDAANSIGKLPPAKARPALVALLDCCENGNSELRKSVLGVISKIVGSKDTSAIGPLREALKDRDNDVRIAAALSLANIGGKEAADAALPTLKSSLLNGDIEMRRQAAAVFRNFGEAAKEAVPALREALTDADVELRGYAAVGLAGIGAAAVDAIPDLVKRVADAKEETKARTESANALSRMGASPAAVTAVPELLKVLGNTSAPPKVRERILWALRVHNVDLRNMNGVFKTFEGVLHEPPHIGAKMLRYDSAYMLGMLQADKCSKKTVEVLDEWLQDGTIQIFTGTDVGVDRTSIEGKSDGQTSVVERGNSDGRMMVIQALKQIGAQKAVTDVPAIRNHLRELSVGMGVDPNLKTAADEVLKSLR